MPGDHHVSKRSTWLTETDHEHHHMSKGILLHALGNAAMSRSLPHLLTHAEPNRGHQVWRRAALDALGRYTCTQVSLNIDILRTQSPAADKMVVCIAILFSLVFPLSEDIDILIKTTF